MDNIRHVTIYTDGACIGNPGPGGYGIVMLCDDGRREISGGYRLTTNNRMEIMAAIVALEALSERSLVTLFSDSEYLVKAMSKGWAQRWRKDGWKRNKREHALNYDLWERLLRLGEHHEVQFQWIKGHAADAENIRSDQLAMQAARGTGLLEDEGYEGQKMGGGVRQGTITL